MKISLQSIGLAHTLLMASLIFVAEISAQWSHDFEQGVIPVVIDGEHFNKTFNFKAKHPIKEIFRTYRELKE